MVTDALRKAFRAGGVAAEAIFQSDRGSQYSAGSTRALLASYDCRQSMGAAGYCYRNAFAESAFASIITEMLPEDEVFASNSEARTATFDYIETFHNRRRLHGALGYQSP